MIISAIITAVCVVTAAGAMFTYYMQTNSSHGVGRLWEIKNNSGGSYGAYEEMGNYDILFAPTGLTGGDSESFNFQITLSGNSNANKPLYFTLYNPYELDGVNVTITNTTHSFTVDDTNPTDSITFSPSDEIEFTYTVSFDAYTPEGTYNDITLLLEKN